MVQPCRIPTQRSQKLCAYKDLMIVSPRGCARSEIVKRPNCPDVDNCTSSMQAIESICEESRSL
jgi:hypothetical protein